MNDIYEGQDKIKWNVYLVLLKDDIYFLAASFDFSTMQGSPRSTELV